MSAADIVTIPSRPIIRRFWRETKSVEQVAKRTGISLERAWRPIVAMLREEGNA